MSWLSSLEGARRLDEAVSYFNEALDVLERGGREVDAARCLSAALDRIPAEGAHLASREQVGEVETLQAMLDLIDLLLDKPGERLVIYGTLAPGRANHWVIEGLRGRYRDCSVHGRISEVDGFPRFTWAPSEDSLGALLFSSKQLPEKWDDLDRFEGDGYKRRLIPATTDDGLTVASIYLSTAGG